jgi:hypothetical protein
LFFTLSCQDKKQEPAENTTKAVVPEKPVSNNSANVSNFEKFRDAVKSGDAQKVKRYFRFPVRNPDLWSLIENKDIKTGKKYDDPFTEADFDTYHDIIFNKDFIAALLAVDKDKLNKTGTYTTPRLKKQQDGVEVAYWIRYEYYPGDEMILALNYEFYDEGEKVETAFIYFFTLDKNGVPTFKKLMLAG